MRRHAFAAAVLLSLTGGAAAESLITSVSTPRVLIQSNFSGADIVVFGGIGREIGLASHGRYDIVITVKGPVEPIDVRLKERRAGIWINAERRHFADAPAFLAIASSRSIGLIATPDTIRRFGLSLDSAMDGKGAGTNDPDERTYRAALIRLMGQAGLFVEKPAGVTFLSDDLFRATVPLPANVPLGIYQVETRLLIDGEVVTGQRASLEVIKTGVEDQLAQWARSREWLYGGTTCAMALALGWLATVVFRRD